MYWKPTIGSGGSQLNDYQYIKCKWLFELLTSRAAVLHKDYGFLIQARGETPIGGFHGGLSTPVLAGPNLSLGRGKAAGSAPSLRPLDPSYWPHELLGNRYRLFNTVLIKAFPRRSGS